ncbi:biotin transporter BioY [Paludicola sp. MB14-C6]|uniref:biotin transporter BioY n=1 Tax=Paludihabitans sp. MB14-C6 TaxID=3070656 RepID=UPI0027DB6B05|nr:biotin transporter BioY [Paludicola sp. MB14-C6]WMJ22439.1 biotin transporter BioY [Paludicola sp. MB14-C6]
MSKTKFKTKSLVLCALFTALIIIGAFIKIPTPLVPITFQVTFCMLAGLLLGSKWGAMSVAVYIALGLMGIPVFTEGGGIGYVLKPTFGYIIGFMVGAFIVGLIIEKVRKQSFVIYLIASLTGLMVVYLIGTIYVGLISAYVLNAPIPIWPLVTSCFFIPLPKDILLCILASLLCVKLVPILRKGNA